MVKEVIGVVARPMAKYGAKPPLTKLTAKQALGAYEVVVSKIAVVRGQRVMFAPDLFAPDLAEMYGVETKVLLQAVRRNIDRFPSDFMFSLTEQEFKILRSQIVTSSWGGTRYLPYAFSEQGVAMLSSVLRSGRAVPMNIEIMRGFVQMRSMIDSNRELSLKVATLEAEYDEHFAVVFKALRELMDDKSAPQGQNARSASPKLEVTDCYFKLTKSLYAINKQQTTQ